MACQTGIRASPELLQTFNKAKLPGNMRAIKIVVKNEQMVCDMEENIGGDWQNDWARLLPRCLDDKLPCYVLFKLDSTDSAQSHWALVNWAPDSAPTKQKMLVAATRATLKSEFGQCFISDEMHATTKVMFHGSPLCETKGLQNEATIDAYKNHQAAKQAPGPMTEVEYELHAVKAEQDAVRQRVMASRSLAAQTLRGLAFPIDQSAQQALIDLKNQQIAYVQLSVDTLNEAIKLEKAEQSATPSALNSLIPKRVPRYNFYRFKHSHEGEVFDSIVFIYSMPAQGSTIKERMLFSSCKGQFLDTVEKYLDLKTDKKIEIDSADEIDEQFLVDHLHPQIQLHQPLFAKPKGPAGRGGRRMVVKPQS